ncbi:MAG: hypothetical protein LAT76_04350, partial [Schleiferiaceae bacterium]|nr:hypothetical protein [Schleiferiaceae bacterium]
MRITISFGLFFMLLSVLPLRAQPLFVQNNGQWAPHIHFKYEFPGGAVFFEDTTITFALIDPSTIQKAHTNRALSAPTDVVMAHAYKVHIQGANVPQAVFGSRKQAAYYNYFIGNDPQKWKSDVPTYQEIRYKSVYPGVDLRFYHHPTLGLKYDFILENGEEYTQIALRYEGLSNLQLKEG